MNIKNSLLYLLLLMVASSTQAQDREILFIHGLQGNADNWNKYENYFPSIPTSTNLIIHGDNEYNSTVSLVDATDESRTDFLREGINNPETAIAFGHSMGGLVARQLDYEFKTTGTPMLFGGIVTAGTSNQGAYIFNSIHNGDLQLYFGEACTEVVVEPIGSALSLAIGVGNGMFNAAWAQRLNPLSNTLSNFASAYSKLPIPNGSNSLLCDGAWWIMNQFNIGPGMYNTPSGYDLKVGATAMNTLNTFQTNQNANMPMVTVWGNEQRPVHWRQWQSAMFSKPASPNFPLNHTADEGLMKVMDGVATSYYIGSGAAMLGSLTCAVGGFWYPPAWAFVLPAAVCSVEFYQGAYWIENDSEIKWSSMIGATSTATVNMTTQNFSCLSQLVVNGLPWLLSLSWNDIESCFTTGTIAVQVPIMLPNDGVVAENEAKIPNVCDIRVDEANHQELRNHPNATQAYEDIFNQVGCVHSFFKTN